MNYKIATALGLVTLIIPVGIALAESGGDGGAQVGVGVSQNLNVGVNLGSHGDADNENASTSADVEVGEHSATTSLVGGEENGLSKHFGTTTPRGVMHDASSTDEHGATSSEDHGNGIGRGGIVGFFQWLFGLPATTTVGDIRAQIEATTTASTTSSSNGLGFFARLFNFLHFGGNN
jgi:hypothetical protein